MSAPMSLCATSWALHLRLFEAVPVVDRAGRVGRREREDVDRGRVGVPEIHPDDVHPLLWKVVGSSAIPSAPTRLGSHWFHNAPCSSWDAVAVHHHGVVGGPAAQIFAEPDRVAVRPAFDGLALECLGPQVLECLDRPVLSGLDRRGQCPVVIRPSPPPRELLATLPRPRLLRARPRQIVEVAVENVAGRANDPDRTVLAHSGPRRFARSNA